MTGAWPALPLDRWQDTYATVQLWTQILGKTRLALSPPLNHWWHTALYVSTVGLTTSPLAYGDRSFEVELDFVNHRLVIRICEGGERSMPLEARPLADFYRDYHGLLRSLDIEVPMWPVPTEVADRTPFPEDRRHASYDREAMQRCHTVLRQVDRVLKASRAGFLGKQSPVHFWWGAFDLVWTTFSGRAAPVHPGGVPYIGDHVVREAYSHECYSVGWWPGGGFGVVREPLVREPAFYAYAAPEPAGFARIPVPSPAYYHPGMCEWILPYDAVRTAPDPDRLVRAFVETTYRGAADLGGWDCAALERPARSR